MHAGTAANLSKSVVRRSLPKVAAQTAHTLSGIPTHVAVEPARRPSADRGQPAHRDPSNRNGGRNTRSNGCTDRSRIAAAHRAARQTDTRGPIRAILDHKRRE